MVSKIDVCVIIILVSVVSIIIGFNIVSLIDKKISNVCINIPPIKIPPPQVNVTIKREDTIPKIVAFQPKTVGANVENFASVSSPDNKQELSIEASVEETSVEETSVEEASVEEASVDTNGGDSIYKNMQAESKAELQYALSEVQDYTPYTPPNTGLLGEHNAPVLTVEYQNIAKKNITCNNKSINSRFETGKKFIKPNQNSCSNEYMEDPSQYYKKKFHAPVANLEDTRTFGANYQEYSNYANPYSVGEGLIKKTPNLPFGYNFAFDDTSNKKYFTR